jgi:long-chain fatty acid transport protein
MTVVINPTIAFNVSEALSFGAGIDYMYGKVKYEKSPIIPGTGGAYHFKAALDGTGDAWGYNLGILLKASKNLKVGFSYRSPFHLTLKDGDFVASDNNFGSPTTVVFPPGTTKASGTLQLPATAALGVAYTLDRLTLSADADWTFWSSYKSLKVTNSSVANYSINNRKDWKDVCALRFGAEYRVTDPLALRAGFVYDPTPSPADTMGPELPDATRVNYMVGAGYKVGPYTIDGAFQYINKFDRTVSNMVTPYGASSRTGSGFNGTWSGNAWLVGMDVGYKF